MTSSHDSGLEAILKLYGEPHVSGSYALDLMSWRDLDIYLEVKDLSEMKFFLLGGRLASLLKPVKMNFRNELQRKTAGLPKGLYWGIYLGDERMGAWKIDIWAVDKGVCTRLLDFCSSIKRRLTSEKASQILSIKSQCWQDPEYRRSYSSADIYRAVLEENIASLEGFKEYLNRY